MKTVNTTEELDEASDERTDYVVHKTGYYKMGFVDALEQLIDELMELPIHDNEHELTSLINKYKGIKPFIK